MDTLNAIETTPAVTKLNNTDDMQAMDELLLRRRFQRGSNFLRGEWEEAKAGPFTVYRCGDWQIGMYATSPVVNGVRQFTSRITLKNKALGVKLMLHNIKCADAETQSDKAMKGVERQVAMMKKSLGLEVDPVLNFI